MLVQSLKRGVIGIITTPTTMRERKCYFGYVRIWSSRFKIRIGIEGPLGLIDPTCFNRKLQLKVLVFSALIGLNGSSTCCNRKLQLKVLVFSTLIGLNGSSTTCLFDWNSVGYIRSGWTPLWMALDGILESLNPCPLEYNLQLTNEKDKHTRKRIGIDTSKRTLQDDFQYPGFGRIWPKL